MEGSLICAAAMVEHDDAATIRLGAGLADGGAKYDFG